MSSAEDPCPGAGRCHNASWCASCEATQYGPCDVRARGERCDSHPSAASLEPLLAEAEHEALCADEDAGRAEHEARKAEAIAAKLRETAKARWATLAARKEEVGDLTRALNAARGGRRHEVHKEPRAGEFGGEDVAAVEATGARLAHLPDASANQPRFIRRVGVDLEDRHCTPVVNLELDAFPWFPVAVRGNITGGTLGENRVKGKRLVVAAGVSNRDLEGHA